MDELKLRIVGNAERRAFGLRSDEALQRQLSQVGVKAPSLTVVAAADSVVTTPTLQWLVENPDRVLLNASGAPRIGATRTPEILAEAIRSQATPPAPFRAIPAAQQVFVTTLRRRETLCAMDLTNHTRADAEREMFDRVYKGVSDVVTKFVWPVPAFHAVRFLAALRITPNAVTVTGIGLALFAAYAFFQGSWAIGLAAGWFMTFLDTVDGKLARVTHRSSVVGNFLDHRTDQFHPPLWWACIARGLAHDGQLDPGTAAVTALVIITAYTAGRLSERKFKRTFGFNQHIWERLDARLRLVIARRNINLVILTFGALTGKLAAAFALLAIWSVLTIGIQMYRLEKALLAARHGRPIRSFLQ